MNYSSPGKIPLGVIATTLGLCADTAMASEGASGDSWINAAWALGLFAVLLLILTRFGFKPIVKAMNDRETALREMNEETARRKAESEELLEEYRERLKMAEQEAADMLERARKDADSAREDILQQARDQASAAIVEAERRINIASRQAMNDLYSNAADLAGDIASRLIGRELTDVDQARIIAERMKNLDSVDSPAQGEDGQ